MKKIGAYGAADPAADGGERQRTLVHRPEGTAALFSEGISFPGLPGGERQPRPAGKALARCRRFEEKKRRLYSAMSCVIGDTLVPVTDFFRFGLHYYAVSEEIPEPRLTGESAVETLPMEDKREILLSLALCLQRLHLQGIVHADLKPEHVLLRKGELGYEAG